MVCVCVFVCQTAAMGGMDLAGLLSNPGFMTMVRNHFLSATSCLLSSDCPTLTHVTVSFPAGLVSDEQPSGPTAVSSPPSLLLSLSSSSSSSCSCAPLPLLCLVLLLLFLCSSLSSVPLPPLLLLCLRLFVCLCFYSSALISLLLPPTLLLFLCSCPPPSTPPHQDSLLLQDVWDDVGGLW